MIAYEMRLMAQASGRNEKGFEKGNFSKQESLDGALALITSWLHGGNGRYRSNGGPDACATGACCKRLREFMQAAHRVCCMFRLIQKATG
jgi:hypothetical protein